MIRRCAVVATAAVLWQAQAAPPLARFVDASSTDERIAKAALTEIAAAWKDSYAAMVIDMARLMRPPRQRAREPAEPEPFIGRPATLDDESSTASITPGGLDLHDPGSPARRRLLAFLERQTGKRFGNDLNRWREWMWTLPYAPHPEYAAFKGLVYGQIDARMRSFFPPDVRVAIRLDEIDWGGVPVNGIPPLRAPKTVSAADAGYLKDSNIVFGVVMNGHARAYPKRILAWHEMAIDRVGGVDLTVVYCTLCGTVIPFESQAGGRSFRFGTSGLLYRSNKLMFDEDTHSLWSTFEGVPVVGPLVGSGIALRSHPVVTTTWKEWRSDHPDTTVLSLETGYTRDYSEGAAYREYFATDRLMFQVSRTDDRLKNKAEVLVMQLRGESEANQRVPVAIDVRLLRKHPVFTFTAAGARFLVVTSPGGANRVFRTTVSFPEQRGGTSIADVDGRSWRVTESGLLLERDSRTVLPRVSAQRAFWFGWYAQFPETILLK